MSQILETDSKLTADSEATTAEPPVAESPVAESSVVKSSVVKSSMAEPPIAEASIAESAEAESPVAGPPEDYSGQTSLTMPKTLHRKLSQAAQTEGVDLNQYIVSMLSEQNALHSISNVQAKLDAVNQRLREREAVMRQMERRAREQRLSYDNRYIEDVDSGLND